MYSYKSHPALTVTRINIKMNPLNTNVNLLTEPKPNMNIIKTRSTTYKLNDRMKFRAFTKAQFKINVNELVNCELYNRASMISGDTIHDLKAHYTPQQMRAFLLIADPKQYQDGCYVKYDVVAPKKKNRGINWDVEVGDMFQIIDNDIIDYSDSDSYKA